MDLQIPGRRALALALTLSLASSAAWAEKTLWLVRPLYPGQETLVDRTEKALDRLMPGDARKDSVIGQKELAGALKGQVATELPCFSADSRCADPIDPFIAGLGFERIVLIQGGQDELGFKYRVVAYEPKTGKVSPASATNANLEKALLGALAKVVPAASTLDVKTTPPGATVYVDDVKVGVTPLNTQVLPGERVVRLDLKLHQPIEETIIIPIRGAASLEKNLEKVAARIVITAAPAGTEIFIDGASVGKDKVDRGIAPGDHVIRLTAEGFKAYEQSVSVKADQQFSLDKSLEAIAAKKEPGSDQVAVMIKGDPVTPVVPVTPPPPPKPSSPEEQIYERRSYFDVSFEYASLLGNELVGRSYNFDANRTTSFDSPGRSLIGASIEYGTFGKYFGVTVFGLSYLTNSDPWSLNVGYPPGGSCPTPGTCGPLQIDNVRAHLVVLRAIQPQLRFAVWHFQFGIQAGLEFRTGQVSGRDAGASTTYFRDGFAPIHLLGAGRLNVRYFVAEGFFIHLQGNFTAYLFGERAIDDAGRNYGSPHSVGFNGGIGYAY